MRPFLTDSPPENLSPHLLLSWQQSVIALNCLDQCLRKYLDKPLSDTGFDTDLEVESKEGHPVLPYLIHASVMFFMMRDLLAFEVIRQQESFQQSPLKAKIRQMPSYQQLMALLNSVARTQPLLGLIQPVSNNTLSLEALQNFKNTVIQSGIPGDINVETQGASLNESPFPLLPVDYEALSHQLLRAWEVMNQWWLSDKKALASAII